MVANILYSDRLNATKVKCHLVAINQGGNYQGNLWASRPTQPVPSFEMQEILSYSHLLLYDCAQLNIHYNIIATLQEIK